MTNNPDLGLAYGATADKVSDLLLAGQVGILVLDAQSHAEPALVATWALQHGSIMEVAAPLAADGIAAASNVENGRLLLPFTRQIRQACSTMRPSGLSRIGATSPYCTMTNPRRATWPDPNPFHTLAG
ncbi:MAG: hypothetical protein ABSG18_15830 [Steroidobacteraceae bacterium]|jgi:hypothetical protein